MPSYADLTKMLGLQQAFPVTANWSAAADFLILIAEHCLQTRPVNIVECSSGLTTLTLARCCQINQFGQVHSLENGDEYADKTRQQLIDFKLDQYAEVIHAPLLPLSLNQQQYQWYSTKQLSDTAIDMLVIDGPPGFIQKHSRYPALPQLFQRMADHCTVFLDDAARQDEKQIISLWEHDYPGISHRYFATERGCSILEIKK